MLRMALAPSACFNVTDELMVNTARLARRYPGVRLHTHLAETQEEIAVSQRTYGCGLGQHLRFAAGMVFLLIATFCAAPLHKHAFVSQWCRLEHRLHACQPVVFRLTAHVHQTATFCCAGMWSGRVRTFGLRTAAFWIVQR